LNSQWTCKQIHDLGKKLKGSDKKETRNEGPAVGKESILGANGKGTLTKFRIKREDMRGLGKKTESGEQERNESITGKKGERNLVEA